jgi:hypothetical protein
MLPIRIVCVNFFCPNERPAINQTRIDLIQQTLAFVTVNELHREDGKNDGRINETVDGCYVPQHITCFTV